MINRDFTLSGGAIFKSTTSDYCVTTCILVDVGYLIVACGYLLLEHHSVGLQWSVNRKSRERMEDKYSNNAVT